MSLWKLLLLDVTFDTSKAKTLVQGYTSSIISFLQWLIPIACLIAGAITVLKYLAKEEEERDRHKLFPLLLKLLVAGILGICLPTILEIVGIM